MQKDKIWTRNFIFLLTSNFLVSISFYLLMTTMAVYAINQYATSASIGGLVASIFVIGALVARLFAGKYIDILGRKKMIYSGLILFLVGSISYLFVSNIALLMVARFLHGIGFGVSTTALTTANMSALPPARRGEGIGYFSLSTAAGTALGPFLALYITSHYSYDTMFLYCIMFSFIALVASAFGNIVEVELSPEERSKIKYSYLPSDFYDKQALPIGLLMFVSGVAYSGVVSFINSYAMELKLTQAASFFFVIYAIFLFVGRPFAGRLLDKKGENIVIYPSYICFAISLVLLALTNNGSILLLAGIFLALGYGNIMSSMQTIVGKVASPQRLGLAISTLFICMDAGMGVGPYILGLIVEHFGFQTMYSVLAIIVLSLIPFYYMVHGKKH